MSPFECRKIAQPLGRPGDYPLSSSWSCFLLFLFCISLTIVCCYVCYYHYHYYYYYYYHYAYHLCFIILTLWIPNLLAPLCPCVLCVVVFIGIIIIISISIIIITTIIIIVITTIICALLFQH